MILFLKEEWNMLKTMSNVSKFLTGIGVIFILGAVIFSGIYAWDKLGSPNKAVETLNANFVRATFLDSTDGEKSANEVNNILVAMKGTDVVAKVTRVNQETKTYNKVNYYNPGGINEMSFKGNQRFNCTFIRTDGVITSVEINEVKQ